MNPAIARTRRYKSARARLHLDDQALVNVGPSERSLSLLGGGVLLACGLIKGSTGGLAVAALGAGLLYRGLTGHCYLYQAMGENTAVPSQPSPSQPR